MLAGEIPVAAEEGTSRCQHGLQVLMGPAHARQLCPLLDDLLAAGLNPPATDRPPPLQGRRIIESVPMPP